MKGASSYHWQLEFQNKGIIINSFDDLVLYYEMASSKNLKVVIQEFIKGPNTNHYKVSAYYSRQHELLGIFTTQKIRQYPVNFGIGTYLVSGYHPEVISLGQKLFEGFGYTGLGSIEFKSWNWLNWILAIGGRTSKLLLQTWISRISITWIAVGIP